MMVTELAASPFYIHEDVAASTRYRRMSSRSSSYSYEEPKTLEIRGEATLCFDEEGTRFQGVIVEADRSHYSIQGRKTPRRKISTEASSSCGCVNSQGNQTDPGDLGLLVSFDMLIKDYDNPMEEYHLKRVHGRNGQQCQFTCSNINFTSLQVHRGHKADMMAQECLGHKMEGGRSTVYCGPISVTVRDKKDEPRHWVL